MAIHPALERLNRGSDQQAQALLLPMIERAPDLAGRIAGFRPFATPEALADRIGAEVRGLNDATAIELFRGHPELAPAEPGAMTEASQDEQGRLGLHLGDTPVELAELNARYFDRFGFPFILALHEHADLTSVITTFRRRVEASLADEIAANKEEICSVARARVLRTYGLQQEPAS